MAKKLSFCLHYLSFFPSVAQLCNSKKPSNGNKNPNFRFIPKSLNEFIEKKRYFLKLKRNKKQLFNIRMRNRSRGVWKENGANRWENLPQWSLGRTYFCNSKKYLYIKTENGYEPYHRFLWKKEYGAIPAGHVVAFKAGADKKNFELKDLELRARSAMITNAWVKK